MRHFLPLTLLSIAPALINLSDCDPTHDAEDKSVRESIIERFQLKETHANRLILLPVELGGKRQSFVLDTGSPVGIYDSSFRPFLGESLGWRDLPTPHHKIIVELYNSPDAKLGKLSLQTGSAAICKSLYKLREASRYDVYDLIGIDFLRLHVLRFDPDRKEVVFLPEVGRDPGRPLHVTWEVSNPHVDVAIAGLDHSVPFVVDTGWASYSGGLSPETFDAITKAGAGKVVGMELSGSLGGFGISPAMRVQSLTVGKDCHRNLIFTKGNRNVLGLGFWSRYIVTFDFLRDWIYVKEGKRFNEQEELPVNWLTCIPIRF
jgi:hypothetical protein